ncbi:MULTISPECIES: histidine phosphatase family protein [Pseudomonas]|uniref:Phosphoglycerate mutase n=2 Tax=Pseudomonas luteola TaxID=47886 RepID=A0A2X2CYJ7_PSELU|nr:MULTISPECIES: histidine phosphatase family protein [Pseudomonas]SHI86828.1 Broad specificity phosphatase PhoE [Pseudomonas zeshuii]SPZ12134.1 phosphoglycerate mutase [Pseudomonas luteola]
MKIILMRHGQPTLKPCPGKVSPSDMHRWISDYNLSEVMDDPAPLTTRELTAQAKYIISSTMPRALTSLDRLGLKPFQNDTLFSEAELPFLHWPGPRLSPLTWAFVFRMLWLCGYSHGVESFSEARERAQRAAQRLISLAEEGTVLLLGHGIMNRLIARQLLAHGWKSETRHGNKYWSASFYILPARTLQD